MNTRIVRISTIIFLVVGIVSWAFFHIGISEKEIEVPSFTHLQVIGPFDVVFVPENGKVRLNTDTRLLDQISIKVENDTLKAFPLSRIQMERVLELQVPISIIRSMNFGGAVEAVSTIPLTVDSLTINLNGASDLNLNSNTQFLEAISHKGSNLFLSGNTKYFDVTIKGNGELMAYQLKTVNTRLKVNSTQSVSKGICRVWATDSLKVDLEGSRGVYYRGNPTLWTTTNTPKAQIFQIE